MAWEFSSFLHPQSPSARAPCSAPPQITKECVGPARGALVRFQKGWSSCCHVTIPGDGNGTPGVLNSRSRVAMINVICSFHFRMVDTGSRHL